MTVGPVLVGVPAGRPNDTATEPDDGRAEADGGRTEGAPDVADLARRVEALESELDEKVVRRADLESDLRGYVRRRVRRGHARGWGPYLVLLYGTLMTLGAFYWLGGGWSILAMIVVWLSTLGLYVLMVLFGIGLSAAGTPVKAVDWVRERR